MALFERNRARFLLNNGKQNNGNNKNNQNNQRQHNSGKAAQQQKQKGLAYKAAEIVRRFDEDDEAGSDREFSADQNMEMSSVNAVKEVLSNFTSEFDKTIEKPAECRELIESSFGDVAAAMRYYYDPKFEDALPDMNRVLDIMTTNHFASIFYNVLKQNVFDDWDDMWKDVALTISILLETSSSKMKEGTVQIYVSDILASSGMWKTEIKQMVEEIGITEDLATDLIIGLPVKPEDMNDLMMRSTYQAFLMAILEHADENIEILDRAAQRKLFDFFFDDGKGSKLACKVIGRYLSDEVPEKELSGAEALIFGEFKAMLLEKLETYDVNNISFVLRFIVDQKKRKDNKAESLFSAEEAAKYDTIRKAIMQVISKDESAKAYLV